MVNLLYDVEIQFHGIGVWFRVNDQYGQSEDEAVQKAITHLKEVLGIDVKELAVKFGEDYFIEVPNTSDEL